MFQVVVCSWQVGDDVAVEQPRAVAAGDLAEVTDRCFETTRAVAVTGHGTHQPVETTLNRGSVLGVMVIQDVRRLVPPSIGTRDVRPQRRGLLQAAPDQDLQARERRRATRSRLFATISRRRFSFRPEAANGGRPSSVMALRTAAH
jgi:hypothetical protein